MNSFQNKSALFHPKKPPAYVAYSNVLIEEEYIKLESFCWCLKGEPYVEVYELN